MRFLPEGIRRLVYQDDSRDPRRALGDKHAVVVCVCAQKGGVGKTTTAVNVASGLSLIHERRVLLIDADAQGHVLSSLHGEIPDPATNDSLSEVLLARKRDVCEIVLPTRIEHMYVTPSDKQLSETESVLAGRIGKEFLLRSAIKIARTQYDFIVVDCPPAIGNLTLNALVASDWAIIPCDMSVLSLEGVDDMVSTIETVNERLSHSLKIMGLLPTRIDKRNVRVNAAIEEGLQSRYGALVFNTSILVATSLAQANLAGVPIFRHDPTSRGAENYRDLVGEILSRVQPQA